MSVLSAQKEVWNDSHNMITLQSGGTETRIGGCGEVKEYFSFLNYNNKVIVYSYGKN